MSKVFQKMSASGYAGLLKSLNFQSFLWTQFLGAFNDNVFKIVLSMIAVNLATDGSGGGYVSMVGAVFILPFFIFSGYAGYASDVFNKRTVLIITKSFEIVAVTVGFFAFWSGRIELMLATLFLMAVHSTFFSPAKYGIVPEMLPDSELSRANGLLEMSTFFAIIIGTSAGTIMYSAFKDRLTIVGAVLIAIAVLGTLMSFGIPKVPPSGATSRFRLNPWGEIGQGLKSLVKTKLLLFTVGGITYFWFMGTLLQMDILLLGKEVMGLTDFWVGILITFLAIGIGTGSIVAGKLSGDKVEPGLVPLGSIGMGIFSVLLALSPDSYPRTAAAMIMVGFSAGLFIVPLNALLQQKSGSEEKGRIIATNNFVNTGGILLASGVLWLMTEFMHIPADRIILIFGLVTLVATVWMFKALPDFLMRFVFWMLTHTLYKIKIVGQENVPLKGPALLVSNHMSFVDAFLIGACVQRFIRFMIYEYFYRIRGINWLLRLMKAVPIADGNRREVLKSLEAAREELRTGHMVCVFAEGSITRTGNLLPFKKGFERIVEGLDVPIIPVHLDRVWGSIFSFKGMKFFWKLPTHFPYPVTVSFGEPLYNAKAHEVRQAVMELGSSALDHRRVSEDLLHIRFIKTAGKRLFSTCMSDSTGKKLTWAKTLAASFALSGWIEDNAKSDNVAIMLPASVGGALANISCLMAGKTSVNLNFTAGQEAVSKALDQCGADRVITSRAFLVRTSFPEDPRMVFIEDIMEGVSSSAWLSYLLASVLFPARFLSALFCRGKHDPNALATIIFTSGSTGEPKGVMLSHHNIVSNIEGFSQVFHVSGSDTVVSGLPFFHTFGYTATIWFPLITGFSAAYHANPLDPKGVGELAGTRKGTILIGTPAFYKACVRKCRKEDFSHMRYAIAGAEKLSERTAAEFKAAFGKDLLEGYGCTEMSPVISVNVHDVEDGLVKQQGRKAGTVGHPIPGVSVKTIDPETDEDLLPGEGGLLLVKSPGLMLGYYKDPEATAKVMRDGWYATGDIATVGDDGFITILDRISRFSKIGGEMVPHMKIEEALSRALGCDCAVTSIEDESRGERLFAFHTRAGLTSVDAWGLIASTALPRLWLPKRDDIVHIDKLPAGPTGKIDLRKLKEMARELAGA